MTQKVILGGIQMKPPTQLAEAIRRAQRAHGHYSTLEQFAKDFNPLANELFSGESITMGSPAWEAFQQLCIELFEYGDAKWPGKVFETGVSCCG